MDSSFQTRKKYLVCCIVLGMRVTIIYHDLNSQKEAITKAKDELAEDYGISSGDVKVIMAEVLDE